MAYSAGDLTLALALLERPADEVGGIVLDDWDRLVDPATSAAELAVLAGLPPTSAGTGEVPASSSAPPCP